jgi:hypothetical protein
VLVSQRRKRKTTTAISDKQNSNDCLRLIEPQEGEFLGTARFKGNLVSITGLSQAGHTRGKIVLKVA